MKNWITLPLILLLRTLVSSGSVGDTIRHGSTSNPMEFISIGNAGKAGEAPPFQGTVGAVDYNFGNGGNHKQPW